eukprot:TCALIF_08206-PA protein Name:"Similar to PGM2 Phosphoglucomutase-2 (Homo sapiens)" AED:0.04 eAED:0.04 QI:1733/0.87/0.77/1/0.87/0.88/9/0/593
MHKDKIDTGDADLDQNLRNWFQWNKSGSKDAEAMWSLVNAGKIDEVKKAMKKRLVFGTAGIRGKMGVGFSYINDLVIIQTSQGLANYVLQANKSPDVAKTMGVVIGFDARHNSHRWARLTGGVFHRLGFTVYLFSSITPTPWVPFTVQSKKAAVGIMITASHNPKQDNGYKVYWSNGPQIRPPHDGNILESIQHHLVPAAGDESFDETYIQNYNDKSNPPVIDLLEVMSNEYYEVLNRGLMKRTNNEEYKESIVYTAMHGVGANFIDRALETAGFKALVHVKEQRVEPDPEFPTVVFPNPEEGKSALNLAVKTADVIGSIHILANDPDADRLAIAEKHNGQWRIFSGNEIGTLLGWFQFISHTTHNPDTNRANLYFIASTVSSKILRSIAREEGLSFEETLTGFKWMGNRADEIEKENPNLSESERKHVLLAYEEAIGFMCGTAVLDKDGISAGLRAAELIAFLGKRNQTLTDKLDALYTTYGYHFSEANYFVIEDFDLIHAHFDYLRNFQQKPNTYPSVLKTKEREYAVVSVRDLTTGYDSASPDLKSKLPASHESQMITFTLDNGTVLTIRLSGTEPKLKYYAEYCAKPSQ